MSDLSQSTLPSDVDTLDTETSRLGQLENELLEVLHDLAKKHQELDREYVSTVNSLLREIDAKFKAIHTLAESSRGAIVPKDKKSAHRLTGNHAWRNSTSVAYDLADDELIERIKTMGQGVSRKLLRTVPSRVIDKNACKLSANEAIVASVDGIRVEKGEAYSVTPTGGFTMTTSRDITKLEGIPLPAVLEAILRDPEA
jgi:phage host-nuclease inhibitor protein Gam